MVVNEQSSSNEGSTKFTQSPGIAVVEGPFQLRHDKFLGRQSACNTFIDLTNPCEHPSALACPTDLALDYALKQYEDASKQLRVVQNRC